VSGGIDINYTIVSKKKQKIDNIKNKNRVLCA